MSCFFYLIGFYCNFSFVSFFFFPSPRTSRSPESVTVLLCEYKYFLFYFYFFHPFAEFQQCGFIFRVTLSVLVLFTTLFFIELRESLLIMVSVFFCGVSLLFYCIGHTILPQWVNNSFDFFHSRLRV